LAAVTCAPRSGLRTGTDEILASASTRDAKTDGKEGMGEGNVIHRLVEALESENADAVAALSAAQAFSAVRTERSSISISEKESNSSCWPVRIASRPRSGSGNSGWLMLACSGPIDVGGDARVPATGKRIEDEMVWVFELSPDGLIVEERDYLDTAALMAQLGIEG